MPVRSSSVVVIIVLATKMCVRSVSCLDLLKFKTLIKYMISCYNIHFGTIKISDIVIRLMPQHRG